MTVSTSAALGILPRADGSASFTSGSTTVIASVNGPMEVKPRDELPQEAFIEVIVRPAIGVAGTRERYLESRLLSAVKPAILRTQHPRTLIQLVLQLVQAASHTSPVQLLAPCINAAVLALLDAAVPLKTVLTATTVVVQAEGGESTHVLAFTGGGELAFVHCEGAFEMRAWERAVECARKECRLLPADEGGDMEGVEVEGVEMEGGVGVGQVLRGVVEEKVRRDFIWRDG